MMFDRPEWCYTPGVCIYPNCLSPMGDRMGEHCRHQKEAIAYEDTKERGFRCSDCGGVESPTGEPELWRRAFKVRPDVHAEGSENFQESSRGARDADREADESQAEELESVEREQAVARSSESIRDREQAIRDTADKLTGWMDWLNAGSPPGEILDYIYRARYPEGREDGGFKKRLGK